jgi:hypothetical protein
VSFGISRIDGNDDSGNRSTSPNRFDGWDILVLFKGSDTYLSSYQNELFSIDPDCAWPTFRLTGQFKRRLIYALLYNGDRFDGIYFDANFGVAIQKPTCKSVPKKTVLP